MTPPHEDRAASLQSMFVDQLGVPAMIAGGLGPGSRTNRLPGSGIDAGSFERGIIKIRSFQGGAKQTGICEVGITQPRIGEIGVV